MAPIYTYQLGWVQGSVANLEYILFEVQPNQHVILRDLVFNAYVASSGDVRVFVRTGQVTTKFEVLALPSAAAMTTYHWDGRQELRLGDQLVVRAQTSLFSCVATGYIFQLGTP